MRRSISSSGVESRAAEISAATYNGRHVNTHGLTLITIVVAALAGIAVLVWILKYWSDTNGEDMGTMSAQWIAEYNASHP